MKENEKDKLSMTVGKILSKDMPTSVISGEGVVKYHGYEPGDVAFIDGVIRLPLQKVYENTDGLMGIDKMIRNRLVGKKYGDCLDYVEYRTLKLKTKSHDLVIYVRGILSSMFLKNAIDESVNGLLVGKIREVPSRFIMGEYAHVSSSLWDIGNESIIHAFGNEPHYPVISTIRVCDKDNGYYIATTYPIDTLSDAVAINSLETMGWIKSDVASPISTMRHVVLKKRFGIREESSNDK